MLTSLKLKTNVCSRPESIGTVLLILFCIQPTSVAQDTTSTNLPPVLTAAKVTDTPPRIDGNLDEDVWEYAPVATGFVQLVPDESAPASERTEVRVLYGDDALYLGSTLFVVWSQGRQHFDPMGEFNLGDDIGTLFDAPAENVFMVKLNYWLNPHEVLQK